MKKLIATLVFTLTLLVGCSSEPAKELGTFVEVKVKDNKVIEHCYRGCYYDYEVTLEKNGTVVTLGVEEEEMFNLLKKGNVVTITYNEDYFITSVIFPTMEQKELTNEN